MEVAYSIVKKVSRYCVLVLLVGLLMTAQTSGRPSYQAEFPTEDVNYCKINNEIDELCQRCAKCTQSNIVFPMCCRNQEEVMDWCDSYINFGIRGS